MFFQRNKKNDEWVHPYFFAISAKGNNFVTPVSSLQTKPLFIPREQML